MAPSISSRNIAAKRSTGIARMKTQCSPSHAWLPSPLRLLERPSKRRRSAGVESHAITLNASATALSRSSCNGRCRSILQAGRRFPSTRITRHFFLRRSSLRIFFCGLEARKPGQPLPAGAESGELRQVTPRIRDGRPPVTRLQPRGECLPPVAALG